MKSNYEELKAAKLERYEELASKNSQLSDNLWKESDKMASVIPMGQPILIGHHSEGRDRRYRAAIHRKMEKSMEASKKAEHYADKVESIESNKAISSDNPEAITLLREKLARLEKSQQIMKDCNKVIKSKLPEAEKIAKMLAFGLSEQQASKLLLPDFCGRIGFASYALTNNNANMITIKKRIESLENIAKIETKSEVINGVTLEINAEDNRVKLFFPGIPAEGVRTSLKHSGFHWSRFGGCWMRQISNQAIWKAKQILNALNTEGAI